MEEAEEKQKEVKGGENERMEEIKTEAIKHKRKINKKVLGFVIVGILALVLVSAAVVSYLSNTVTGKVEVKSPLELKFLNSNSGVSLAYSTTQNGGNLNLGTFNMFSIPASESFNENWVTFSLKNIANSPIQGIAVITIKPDASSFDIAHIGQEFAVYQVGRLVPDGSVQSTCDAIGPGAVITNEGVGSTYCYWNAINAQFTSGVDSTGSYIYQFGGNKASPTTIGAGETIYGKLKLKFNLNAQPDTYRFTALAMSPTNVPY